MPRWWFLIEHHARWLYLSLLVNRDNITSISFHNFASITFNYQMTLFLAVENFGVPLPWRGVSVTRGCLEHGDINQRQHVLAVRNLWLAVSTRQQIKTTCIYWGQADFKKKIMFKYFENAVRGYSALFIWNWIIMPTMAICRIRLK